MIYGMECVGCDAPIFVRDVDEYEEGETQTCQRCGVISRIVTDDYGDGTVAFASSDEMAEDRGQARCDGSDCGGGRGATKEMHGTPCRFDCKRFKS